MPQHSSRASSRDAPPPHAPPHLTPDASLHLTPDFKPRVTLILGGARSGKSRYAQQIAQQTTVDKSRRQAPAARILFVATASASDDEMRAKIQRHRDERPNHWTTVEELLDLPGVIAREGPRHDLALTDCLTLWTANLLDRHGSDRSAAEAAIASLVAALLTPPCNLVLVSNEAGSGVVPSSAIGGTFRDLLGEINQRVAAVATDVVLMVAGIPLVLKSAGNPPR